MPARIFDLAREPTKRATMTYRRRTSWNDTEKISIAWHLPKDGTRTHREAWLLR